jgi:hypothetical protein
MRKECVGEPGCSLGFANLSITLGFRGAAVVNQLSFRGGPRRGHGFPMMKIDFVANAGAGAKAHFILRLFRHD